MKVFIVNEHNAIIEDDNGNTLCQSYNMIIAKRSRAGFITLDERYYDYSKTTGKHLAHFLGAPMTDTRKRIKTGEYVLANLN